jgi:hypothetical protein
MDIAESELIPYGPLHLLLFDMVQIGSRVHLSQSNEGGRL